MSRTLPSPPPAPDLLTPGGLASHARQLGRSPERWRDAVRFTEPQRFWHRLEHSSVHEVWLLTWLPGQGTEIHSHGGSAGAFTVVQGTLTELCYLPARPAAEHTGRALTVGELRSFGPRYVHQVANEQDHPAVSVHVYAPALTSMTYYEPGPDGILRADRTEATSDR